MQKYKVVIVNHSGVEKLIIARTKERSTQKWVGILGTFDSFGDAEDFAESYLRGLPSPTMHGVQRFEDRTGSGDAPLYVYF